MDTTNLIDRLAGDARPVTPLAPPVRRAAAWFAIALLFVAAATLIGPAPGLARMAGDTRFLVEQLAAAATAVTAAIAAFACTVPGRSRTVMLLPLVPLAVWIGTIGQGCVADAQALGAAGLTLRADWGCFGPMLLAGILPAAAMVAMLRRGFATAPRGTLALGGLAVAAATNLALQTFHLGDISLMVLVWHVGGSLALAAVAALAGKTVLGVRANASRRMAMG